MPFPSRPFVQPVHQPVAGPPPSNVTYLQDLTATLSFAGSSSQLSGKPLSASLTFSGSLVRLTFKGLSASLTFTGSLAKRLARAVAGTHTFSGGFVASHLFVKAFTATLSFAGAMVK